MRAASFHNTVGITGSDLLTANSKAKSQEMKILSFFQANVGRMFSPSEIHQKLFNPLTTPPTSIRRAITNLTSAGYLRKTDIKVVSPYGSPEHCWYLPPHVKKHNQLDLFGDSK